MIIGFWDGHDAGACLVDPETSDIVCAVNEERFTRRKLEVGFPHCSIEHLVQLASRVTDFVATTTDPAKTLTRVFPSMKERYYELRRRKVRPSALDGLKRDFKYELTTWKPNSISRWLSRRNLELELARRGSGSVPLHFVPHHWAHAASAAYTSGFREALVVTLDGVGDGLSGSVSVLDGGKLDAVELISARHSLGIFYEYVTQLLNMRELEDEGKVMALAAYGHTPSHNPLMDLFQISGNRIRCRLGPFALRRFLARELYMVPSEQFARMAQDVLETKVTELISAVARTTGHSRVAVAGGVFSNIQANLRISELPGVEELFVFPHMGDGGLALGAALSRAVELGARPDFSLADLRLGPHLAPGAIDEAVRGTDHAVARCDSVADETARRLADGEIVLWFQGRMEYGPRALGGRSILARPDRIEARDRLNARLKRRVWYQPFCPSILDDEAARLLDKGERPNRYMTAAYRVRPEGRDALAGVTASDGTCRPQMVDESYGPYYDLLTHMKRRIGVGAVLNTSFNLHGEPIVATPADALRTFDLCGADALVIGDYVVEPKAG